MDEDRVHELVREHYANTGVDEAAVTAIYSEDAVLDVPQSGERILGPANIRGFREAYPAAVRIRIRRTVGSGDVWVNEGTISYDGKPQPMVAIWEFEGDRLRHETVYVCDSWDAPAWRAPWASRMPDPAEEPGG
jgi:ketosteroid isomerase-like protein